MYLCVYMCLRLSVSTYVFVQSYVVTCCVYMYVYVSQLVQKLSEGDRSAANWSEIQEVENYSFCSVKNLVYL